MLGFLSRRALTFAFSASFVVSAATLPGAAAQDGQGWGRPSGLTTMAAPPGQNLGQIAPAFQFTNASVGTGAIGLRNRADGGIEVSGVTTPLKKALVYWAVITDGAPSSAVSRIGLKKGAVGVRGFTTIVGSAIGTGASPCWTGDRVVVYRGNIPSSIAVGNGFYVIRLEPGANGNTSGQSPWAAAPQFPLFEGASIVLVGSGTSTVGIYDSHLAGKTFSGQLTYSLKAPVSVATSPEVLVHSIGADGQVGVGVRGIAAASGEITTLNNRRIAGPDSPANEGDWNGTVAGPLPQLWDTTTHDVTTEAKAGPSATILPFVIKVPGDCLVPIANILSIRKAS